MAKMKQFGAKKASSVDSTEATVSDNSVANTPTEGMGVDMQAVLNRLERLEKESDELKRENEELKKGSMNVFVSGKEVYEGPRKYSYKLWGGVPVLSYKSFKKDPTKDLMYKDQFGQWKSNHYLKLALADESEVDVEVNEFNRDYTKSDKLFAEKATDNRGNLLGYEFDTEDRGKIIIAENMIN